MRDVVAISTLALALIIAMPTILFVAEVAIAVMIPRPPQRRVVREDRTRVAVLIPAHNEGRGLLPTLADIKGQAGPADRFVVVADNCTDDTAAVAAAAGAEVAVRNDPVRRGKGYALAYGLVHLSVEPPDIVIVIDADCRLGDEAIDRLAALCTETHRPIQARYLMVSPKDAHVGTRIAEFAWRVKNWIRPLGLNALGLPCQLMGSGMAFPWDVIRSANLATNSIVEDLKLGLELAIVGKPPVFCPTAVVTSVFPSSPEGLQSQRLRWEGGHLGLIVTQVPYLILAALRRRNWPLLVLALDASVPPLSLLGMLVVGTSGLVGISWVLGATSTAFVLSLVNLAAFAVVLFVCWSKYGRDVVTPRIAIGIAWYVLKKGLLYLRLLLGMRVGRWVRTDRGRL